MARTYLHLEDGTRLEGNAIGFAGEGSGEVVFTTGMVGYAESMTDPSYNGQILVFTYPLVGNYGVPKPKTFFDDILSNFESPRIWVRGVVVGEDTRVPSHYTSDRSFDSWLAASSVPGISGIDTRSLTQKLREFGTLRGIISPKTRVQFTVESRHLVAEASIKTVRTYRPSHANGTHVVLIDCGVKHGIVRSLLNKQYVVTRVPWNFDPLAVPRVDAVVCSNGPGDPKACDVTIANIRNVIDRDIPFLGVCLGHQLVSLALGADTYKLPYGHRGVNQPCIDDRTGKAYVTSQNHGYAVSGGSLPRGISEWFTNLNDQTNEGIYADRKSIYSTQFHPEGHPGPYDTEWTFSLIRKS